MQLWLSKQFRFSTKFQDLARATYLRPSAPHAKAKAKAKPMTTPSTTTTKRVLA